MTSIDRLQITGIRSYSPYEPQTIDFYKPLTVIVGTNGSGKTTIIECLKQATTGDLPPNCKNGQNFIHDPNLAVTMEVKGQIKLRFTQQDGKPVVCSRSFNLTQRQKKKEYKALESVLQTVDEHGAKVTMSTKCSDLNKLIPQMMGVSHSILENVIFCHQEEANWCLGDDATLKKKFDEIFASARYTKALDEMRKFKNDLAGKLKVLRAEAESAEVKLSHSQKLTAGLTADRTEANALLAKIEAHDEALRLLQEQLGHLEAKAKEVARLDKLRSDLRAEQREKRKTVDEIRGNIGGQFGDELAGAEDELQLRLDRHTDEQTRRRRELARLQREAEERRSGRTPLEAGQESARKLAAQLLAEAGVQRQQRAERDETVTALVAQLGAQLAPLLGAIGSTLARAPPHAEAHVAQFEQALESELRARESLLADERGAREQQTNELDRLVQDAKLAAADTHKDLKRTLEELERDKAELKRSEARMGQLLSELTQGGHSASASASFGAGGALGAVEQLRAQITAAEARLDELREARESEGLGSKMAQAKREGTAAKGRHKQLLEELSLANSRLAYVQQYESNLKLKNRKEAEISQGLDGLKDELAQLLDGARDSRRALVDGSLARQLRVVRDGRSLELQRANKAAAEAGNAVREMMGSQKERDSQIKAKRKAIERAEAEVHRVDPQLLGADVDSLLRAKHDEVAACKSSVATLNFVPLFAEQAERALASNHVCHLCQRHVPAAEEDGVKAAFTALKTKATSSAGVLDLREKLAALEAQQEVLAKVAPQCRSIQQCRGEIGALEAAKASTEQALRGLHSESETASEAAKRAGEAHEMAARCTACVERLGPVVEEFQRAKAEVDRCNEATDTSGARSHEEVADEAKAASARSEELDASLEQLRLATERSDSNFRQADGLVKELEAKLLGAEHMQEKHQAEEGQLKKLRERIASLELKERTMRAASEPAQKALAQAEARRSEVKQRLTSSEAAAAAQVRELQTHSERLLSMKRQLAQYAASGAEAQLAEAQLQESEAKRKLDDNQKEVDRLDKTLKDAGKALSSADSEVAELKENIRLRKLQQELKGAETQLEQVSAEYSRQLDEDRNLPQALLEQARKKQAEVTAKRAEAIGRRSTHSDAIKAKEKELKSQEYSGVDAVHRAKMIDVQTHALVIKDLDSYYKVLDRSLMKFHSKKMEAINATIRELWQRTYQGHDIDSIEIQSEHEGETATGKRIHKYRVVMRRGDAYLDMRGRCSAGQKVLASLIIRLALAETFCLNCGILALDEPTTNLDHANVESFARALNEIIQQRRSQSNFQLIVITHDEPFVQLIGRAENADFFYRVFKNEQQYSVVQKQAIADF